MSSDTEKKSILREYFSIPNCLSYFRIILIPIYLTIVIKAETNRDYYLAAFVMLLSFLSDFLDGKIARRFNMVTQFGKILDPIADKLTQGTLALSFAIRYRPVIFLLAVFLVKELCMGLIGLWMMHKGWRTKGAEMHGKINTGIIDGTMLILLLFPGIPSQLVLALSCLCIVSILISFGFYLRTYYRDYQEMKTAGAI